MLVSSIFSSDNMLYPTTQAVDWVFFFLEIKVLSPGSQFLCETTLLPQANFMAGREVSCAVLILMYVLIEGMN